MNDKTLGYIAGVLDGDGWIDRTNKKPRICLGTTNLQFAMLFKGKLSKCGLIPYFKTYEKTTHFNDYCHDVLVHYVRATCDTLFLSNLNIKKSLDSHDFCLGYLKGFFDSEGDYSITQNYLIRGKRKWKNGVRRAIRFWNKDTEKLRVISKILERFGIMNMLYVYSRESLVEIHRILMINKFLKLTNGKFGGYKRQ